MAITSHTDQEVLRYFRAALDTLESHGDETVEVTTATLRELVNRFEAHVNTVEAMQHGIRNMQAAIDSHDD